MVKIPFEHVLRCFENVLRRNVPTSGSKEPDVGTFLYNTLPRLPSWPPPGPRPLRLEAASTADGNGALVHPDIDERQLSCSASSTSDSVTQPGGAPRPAPDGTSRIALVTRPDSTYSRPTRLPDQLILEATISPKKRGKGVDWWHGFRVVGDAAWAGNSDPTQLPMRHHPKPGTHATDHLLSRFLFFGEIIAHDEKIIYRIAVS